MALLIETVAARTATTPTRHPVPPTGVLLFPGVGPDVPPPAQLGPMMSPPGRAGLFGR
jgi:hypothetical protein